MWSEAFLAQAKSDWQIYEHLEKTSFSKCHALHYLQMATEKLAKAYNNYCLWPTKLRSLLRH